jgi:hypothetical protein
VLRAKRRHGKEVREVATLQRKLMEESIKRVGAERGLSTALNVEFLPISTPAYLATAT